MMLFCIDPGTNKSGFVRILENGKLLDCGVWDNELILENLQLTSADHILIEMVESYGMPVGVHTFKTVVWIGRFYERAEQLKIPVTLLSRKEIKLTLCHSARAKDANVAQAIRDEYEPTGGGKDPHKGTKNEPGPLYGIKSHAWSALAIGHAFLKGAKKYHL